MYPETFEFPSAEPTFAGLHQIVAASETEVPHIGKKEVDNTNEKKTILNK
jgi:hypothetical protein